jgi:hypothetical protein
MVEGRDRNNYAYRLLCREGPSPRAGRSQSHRDFPASEIAQLLGRVPDAVDRAVGLNLRVYKWLAAFLSDEPAELLAQWLH